MESRFEDLLISRPSNMSFEEYKKLQHVQNTRLNVYLQRGRLFWLAKELVTTEVPYDETKPELGKKKIQYMTKGNTYNHKLHGELEKEI